jgi:YfiH family protein
LVCAEQIHDNKIKYVELQDLGKGALIYDTCIKGVDALITDNKDIPLAIFTADCLSVFLYDRGAPAIGLVHAGWRGTKENITPGTLQLMLHQFNSKISDVYVGFGPAIRECCYEVGKEFFELFPDNLYERDNRYYLDLVKINKRQLLDLGVRQENILDSGICTSCSNDKFFSYRKEGNACARMMSVIMLR